MKVEPQNEHRWLMQLVGDWSFESEASMGEKVFKHTGTQSTRALGEVWILGEMQAEMPGGGTGTSMITLGFDPQRKRFVGTWIGSMMTYLWVYDGALDASGKILTLDAEGPSMAGDGKLANYQDIIEIVDHDHYTLSSQMQDEDGKWNHFMTGHYHRRK